MEDKVLIQIKATLANLKELAALPTDDEDRESKITTVIQQSIETLTDCSIEQSSYNSLCRALQDLGFTTDDCIATVKEQGLPRFNRLLRIKGHIIEQATDNAAVNWIGLAVFRAHYMVK